MFGWALRTRKHYQLSALHFQQVALAVDLVNEGMCTVDQHAANLAFVQDNSDLVLLIDGSQPHQMMHVQQRCPGWILKQ